MKKHHWFFTSQHGMTLLEVLVTLGALSVLFAGTLTIYSTTYRNFKTRNALLHLVHDCDLVMSLIGDDIRHARELLDDYQVDTSYQVVAAMKIRPNNPETGDEKTIVYALDAKAQNRLWRLVYREGRKETPVTTEVSTHIQALNISPTPDQVFQITLTLVENVAGQALTLNTTSSYAMRY